ncbi:MAG: hypothetical protein OEX11_03285 [Nitrosomonas sp.]|nr:hypothetical protein [Nitrosomonas sp.]
MQGPVAIVLDNRIRVYFSARNINGKSYPAYVDLDKTNPQEVLKIYDQPIMSYGPLGTFNDVLLISHNKMGFSSLHLYSER